jgi:hypothetical protein
MEPEQDPKPAVAQKGRSSVAPGRLFRFGTIPNASRNGLAHLPAGARQVKQNQIDDVNKSLNRQF